MKIVKATVVTQSIRGDSVSLITDLPSQMTRDEGSNSPLILHFECSKGKGADYVRKHIGIEPEVITVS